MAYYVYIVRCADGSFYTGYSKNVGKRVRQHLRGKGARYLRIHKPEELVHVEEFGTRREAMMRERRVKSLTHAQKLRLTRSSTRTKRIRKDILARRKKTE